MSKVNQNGKINPVSTKNSVESSPSRPRSNSFRNIASISPQSRLLSLQKRAQRDFYSLLTLDIMQLEIFHGVLDVIQAMNCEVILDHQKCNFQSQKVKFIQTDKAVIIPFHKKLNILSDDDTDDMTMVIKFSYSNGAMVGIYISKIKELVQIKDLQELPVLSQDSRPIGCLKVKFSLTSEGFFEDSASETSSQQSATPQSQTQSPSPLPKSIPRADEASALSIPRTVPLRRTTNNTTNGESPTGYPQTLNGAISSKPEPPLNIIKDFEEESSESSVKLSSPTKISSSPVKVSPSPLKLSSPSKVNLSIDTNIILKSYNRNDVPETEVPITKSENTRVKSSSSPMKPYFIKKKSSSPWRSFFFGCGLSFVVFLIGIFVHESILIDSHNTLVAVRSNSDNSNIKASFRKKLVVNGPGLSIEILSMNDPIGSVKSIHWKRGIFGELPLFDGLFGGRAIFVQDPHLNNLWNVIINPSKKIQLQHPKSGKCLCPTNVKKSDHGPSVRRLRLSQCNRCDEGYGWSLDGSTNNLIYSSGSSDEYCLSKDKKEKAVLDLCSISQTIIKASVAASAVSPSLPMLSSTGITGVDPFRFSKEIFTDLDIL